MGETNRGSEGERRSGLDRSCSIVYVKTLVAQSGGQPVKLVRM